MSSISHATRPRAEREVVTSADGTPIAVWRTGEGPPLVLVHGAAADHTRWAPVLPALAQRFTVLALDRRGRGGSGDAAEYALAREAEDVVAVVEAAGGPAAVLGHSYGGVCSLEAARLTAAITRLVLYDAPVGFLQTPAPVVEQLLALHRAGDYEELLAVFFREVVGLPAEQIELLRGLPAWQGRLAAAPTIAREERANREYRFRPARLTGVDIPTLLLCGGDSPRPFADAADALAEALPAARIAVMPGQRHAAMDTGTDLFVDEVLRFLGA
jgi:pimeloyl-ACP methyl ester carboxylesterase